MNWNFHQTYTQLPSSLFSRVAPAKVPQPALAILNYELADELGLDTALLSSPQGVAELGPMLREYIISEAMYALNIPTTRGLAVVTTGEVVYRETPLPGAVLTRIAASHIRVGTFQYAASQQDPAVLWSALSRYSIISGANHGVGNWV